MDVPEFITELPVTLANWHSASCHGVPVTSRRSLTLSEYDYLDCGGSGIYIHRPDSTSFKGYQLKCDAMGTSPYYPKCFTIPMVMTNKERYNKVPTKFQLDRNHSNSLMYDPESECLFSADSITNDLALYKLDRDEDSPVQSKLNLISSTSSLSQSLEQDGPICEISSLHRNPTSDDVTLLVRQPKRINFLYLKEENNQLILSTEPIAFQPGDKSLGQSVNEFDEFTEFWKFSKSHLLRHSLALGQFGEDDCVTISDYNLETNQFLWVCKSSRTDFKGNLTWQSPIGLSWVHDHPKLLAYCELSHFGLLDTRDRSFRSMCNVMDRSKLQFAREWEKFRGHSQSSISDHQFLISMDHKVVLVDRRFPHKNLMTWCHMLKSDINDLPRYLSSSSLPNSNESIITLSNKSQACLLTISPFELANITQPHSLHMPIHLSQPVDCWHYSSNAINGIKKRLENSLITGLTVIPAENGYSVCQSTADAQIYVQDFYPFSTIEPEYRVNWKRLCLVENLPIPEGVHSRLESAFQDMQSEPEPPKELPVRSSKRLKDTSRKKLEPQPSIERPKFLMPLPGTSDSPNDTEPEDEVPESVESLIFKRLNLFRDDIDSIEENEFTMKLLSVWRNTETD